MAGQTPVDLQDSTILVIDDEILGVVRLIDFLEASGFNVELASDGGEGLQFAVDIQPDLILLDVMMPEMDGFEVCRRLKKSVGTASIPVIFITALDSLADKARGFEVGGVDYISRPFHEAEVLLRIETHLKLFRLQSALEDQVAQRTAELEHAEKKYRSMFENAVEGIFQTTPEGRFISVNPALARILGYASPSELINSVTDIAQQLYVDPAQRTDFIRLLETQEVVPNFETRVYRKDRSIVWISINARAVRDIEGVLRYYEGNVQDITTRKQAEIEREQAIDALRRSENRYRSLVENLPVHVFVKDLNSVYMSCNSHYAHSLSIEPEAIVGKTDYDFYPPGLAEKYRADDQRVISTGQTLDIEETFTQVEEEQYVRTIKTPYKDAGGDVKGILGIFWDVTERKRAVDALRHNQEHLEDLVAERTRTLDERLKLETLLAELASAFVHVSESTLAEEVGHWLQRTSEWFHLDRCRLFELNDEMTEARSVYGFAADGAVLSPAQVTCDQMPYIFEQTVEKKPVAFSGLDSLPPEAELEREYFEVENIVAGLIVPLQVGAMTLAATRLKGHPLASVPTENAWSGDIIQQLRLIGEILANALLRERAEQALRRQAEEYAALYQQARQVDQLRALNTISAAANASLDLDIVLQRIITLTCQTFDAEEGAILLCDNEAQDLVFVASLQRDQVLKGRRLSLEQGLAGWVVQHSQGARVNDVHQDPRWYAGIDIETEFITHNLLCAPLIYRGQVTGVMEIVNKRHGPFTEDDLSLLGAVTAIAAANIENARLFSATRAYAEDMELLNRIGRTMSASLDPLEVVDTALAHVQQLFNTSATALLMIDPETGENYYLRTWLGTVPVDLPIRIPPEAGFARDLLAKPSPLLIEDMQEDPRFLAHLYQDLEIQIHAAIVTPLLTRNGPIGSVVVVSGQVGVYTSDDVQMLESLASMLAIALENARLYEDIKRALREQQRAQAHLVQAEKMGALGRLAASIAHEINNPLQAIMGGMELAMEELDEGGDAVVVREELHLASAEVERVAGIVGRMREFYRPGQAGFQRVDLHSVLDEVLALSRKKLQHTHVKVEREWALDVPQVQVNVDQLKQVFLNLILNAVDAMPDGGTLRIASVLDYFEASEGGEEIPAVRVDFSDTGEGIPEDVLPHIFEPFFTTKSTGTGLGLSISHSIVDAHGGTLTAASHSGLGTTFVLKLPVAQV